MNLRVPELGSTGFGHFLTPVAKKGMILSLERAIPGDIFFWFLGPNSYLLVQFSIAGTKKRPECFLVA